MSETSARGSANSTRGRRTILLIAAACLAPVVASYAVYYFAPRSAQVNYGTLLPTVPAPAMEGRTFDGAPFRLADLRGRWVLLAGSAADCGTGCEQMLYATRQARTMQGKERDRVVRVWLDAGAAPLPPGLRDRHPELVVARVPGRMLDGLPGALPGIWLVDPLGNLVLRYPPDPDVKGLANDLARLLRASGIG